MTTITEEFVEREIEELKNRQDVNSVAVVGGYATDPTCEHDRLEFYVVIDGDWRKRVSDKIDGVVVETFYNSLEWSKTYLEKEDWWKKYKWYVNADVRYDEDDTFEKLKEKAEDVKKDRLDLSKKELQEISHSIWDMKQEIDSRDVSQKRFMMNQLFEYLLEKQYLLKGEVPVQDNCRLDKLQEFDGYLYKLSQDFLLSSSTMEKEKKLNKIIEHVSRNLPDIDPKWESEKEQLLD